MKLNFSRTGGFANIETNISLNSEKLQEENKTKLQSLLAKVFPAKERKSVGVVDGFKYQLTVISDDGKEETLSANDANMDDDTQSLVDFILELA